MEVSCSLVTLGDEEMSFLWFLSAGPLRCMPVLMGFNSGDLEVDMCVCCSFLEVAQQSITSCFNGETELKFEQNRGGARGSVLLFLAKGEITCSHLGTLPELICSEQLCA